MRNSQASREIAQEKELQRLLSDLPPENEIQQIEGIHEKAAERLKIRLE